MEANVLLAGVSESDSQWCSYGDAAMSFMQTHQTKSICTLSSPLNPPFLSRTLEYLNFKQNTFIKKKKHYFPTTWAALLNNRRLLQQAVKTQSQQPFLLENQPETSDSHSAITQQNTISYSQKSASLLLTYVSERRA